MRLCRSAGLTRKVVLAAATGVSLALAAGSLVWACTVPIGFTWYADGSVSKTGAAGTVITAYATGARPNRQFLLVTGNTQGTPGHEGHACMFNIREINPTPRTSSSTGFIASTTGAIAASPGVWQVCFREPVGVSATIPVSFTVT